MGHQQWFCMVAAIGDSGDGQCYVGVMDDDGGVRKSVVDC